MSYVLPRYAALSPRLHGPDYLSGIVADVYFLFGHCSDMSLFKSPTVISVINHLTGHAAIDADVLARDETSLVLA